MPQAPRKPCRKPNCGVLTHTTYCEKHTVQNEEVKKEEVKRYDNSRGTSASRGYSYKWSKASALYRKNNPLCVMCQKQGVLKINNCVDHIVPVNGPDDPLFWVESNWQGLCTSCHSRKTALEDGAMGNAKRLNRRL